MIDPTVVTTYFIVGVAVSVAIGLMFVLANMGFYAFCWLFVKIDEKLQNHYWKKIHCTLKNTPQKQPQNTV